jgi:hypothetical protein
MPKKKHKKSDLCPLCGQALDLYCTGNRNTPFVDGKTYSKLCFTCYNVPKTIKQVYDEEGSVVDEVDLGYSPKHLHTAKELVDLGPADNMIQARRSVAGVRSAIKMAKLKRGAKFTKPKDAGTELGPDPYGLES